MNYYSTFVNIAKGLDGFVVGQKEDVPYDITDLMNGYCKAKDAHDEIKMNQYISALIVRYWHVVTMLYNKSLSTRLEFDEIVGWVYESIEKACKYRSWLDINKAVSKDPRGAEKVLNQCITSTRQYWYKHFNQDKRKINFLISDSLDETIPFNHNDVPVRIIETIEDPESNICMDDGKEFIQRYLNAGKLFEAIVLDSIMYQDSFIDSEKTSVVGQDEETGENIEITKYNSEFSIIKFRKNLKNIDESFIEHFSKDYDVDIESLIKLSLELKKLSRAQLNTRVDKAFKNIQTDKELLEWIRP